LPDSTSDAQVLASLVDDLPLGVWVARAPDGEFVYANHRFAEIMGMQARSDVARGSYSQPYSIHTPTGELYPEERLPFVRALVERRVVTVDDIVIHRHDGAKVALRAIANPIARAGGEISHVVIAFFDISREVEAERSRAESEARLQRAQRMEAIGHLAGGIAHDFNNLLTAIQAIASKLAATEADDERREDLRLINDVTERAAQLTRALLGFSRRTKRATEAVSLHQMAQSMVELFRRTLDPRIDISLSLRASTGEVAGDLSQLEQVLMNLVVNARDAMPDGGTLEIRTVDVDAEHVALEVVDTGSGIDTAIRDRIFEPYFTTKSGERFRSSGLGLATVYGIVEAHAGSIEVLDHRPTGTIMRIVLAAAPAQAERAQVGARPAPRSGHGVVLLVEDEALVRVATFRSLKQLGYQVVACGDGDEAVDIYRARRSEISAVMLDMLMPRMGGRDTYLALREIDPDVKVLLTTGFAQNDEVQRILELGAREFIAKPYGMDALSQAMERVLAAPVSGATL
jgi:PAS domain S-box-containing protein